MKSFAFIIYSFLRLRSSTRQKIKKSFDSQGKPDKLVFSYHSIPKKYFDSGDLEVTEKSFGEGDAPPGVSDDVSNLRESVYSPAASKERRVEIIEIVKDGPQQ